MTQNKKVNADADASTHTYISRQGQGTRKKKRKGERGTKTHQIFVQWPVFVPQQGLEKREKCSKLKHHWLQHLLDKRGGVLPMIDDHLRDSRVLGRVPLKVEDGQDRALDPQLLEARASCFGHCQPVAKLLAHGNERT